MIYKIYFSVIFVLFLCFSNKSFTQTIPPNFATESINAEVKSNLSYLSQHAIWSSRGYIPVHHNNKWGLDYFGRIVLPIEYDSIFSAGVDLFVTVKQGEYQLLDEEIRPFFKEPMSNITFDGKGTLMLYDKKGNKRTYHYHHNLISPHSIRLLHQLSGDRYVEPIYPSEEFLVTASETLDSIVIYRYTPDSSFAVVYPKKGKPWSVNYEDSYNISDDGYATFSVSDGKKILNLATGKTIVHAKWDDYLSVDYRNSELIFRLQRSNKEILCINLNGDTLLSLPQNARFDDRYVYLFDEKTNTEKKYTFIEFKKKYNVKSDFRSADNFSLRLHRNKKKYQLFYGDKCIRTIQSEDRIYDKVSEYRAIGDVTAISLDNGQEIYTYLYSSEGNLIWKGPDFLHFQYDETVNQLRFFCGNRGENDNETWWVIDFVNQTAILIPFHHMDTYPLGSNFLIKHERDSAITLHNLKGEYLENTKFDSWKVYKVGKKQFVSLSNENKQVIYSMNYDLICDSCYAEDWLNTVVGTTSDRFLFVRMAYDPLRYQIFDESGKIALTKMYLAVHFFATHSIDGLSSGGYFAALNDKHEIEYFRLDEISKSK